MLAAPARVLAAWAGIPRKGWRLRALYQRWVTPGRAQEVERFRQDAAAYNRGGHRFLLGPTALTLATTRDVKLEDGRIVLAYESGVLQFKTAPERLGYAASEALTDMKKRLSASELESLDVLPNIAQPIEYEA